MLHRPSMGLSPQWNILAADFDPTFDQAEEARQKLFDTKPKEWYFEKIRKLVSSNQAR
ncbi:hypothetical protein KIN20_028544 [Parelaphostrongylus tenuis]|uniref:Uncharacterized protein n=1 Tax=Parelaphostrongylus tenuis TaxID=148309 RepID=A0AAD5R0X9_PARTN|nr:hypothetical protein KIN20_028544 [Parelaphostrongylus tenuis]